MKKTYEEREPIVKETIIMPTKVSKKVRTTKPVFIAPIYVKGEEGLKEALEKNQSKEYEENIPLPTASVINNLCKDSVVQSSYYSEVLKSKTGSKINDSKYNYQNPEILKSKQQKLSLAQKSMHQSKYKQEQNLQENDIDKPMILEGEALQNSNIKIS